MTKTRNVAMRREYDFSGGVRGKHYRALLGLYKITVHKADGTTVVKHVKPVDGAVVLEPRVRRYFRDSEAVNKALRGLIALLPRQGTKARP